MSNLVTGLLSLSVLAFLLAVVESLTGRLILGIPPEGYSRACSNLALIAIGLALTAKKPSSGS